MLSLTRIYCNTYFFNQQGNIIPDFLRMMIQPQVSSSGEKNEQSNFSKTSRAEQL